jgi:hypothetical protein
MTSEASQSLIAGSPPLLASLTVGPSKCLAEIVPEHYFLPARPPKRDVIL